jgi:hypothetical protein
LKVQRWNNMQTQSWQTYQIKSIPQGSYAEVPQQSPMRWVNLTLTDDGYLKGLSRWWKCKDFMNDVVIKTMLGKSFPMYGFDNSVFSAQHCNYVGVKNVGDFFVEWVTGFVNPWLLSKGLPEVSINPAEGCDVEWVLGIPIDYFQNTFFISSLTSIIRAGTYGKVDHFRTALEKEPTLRDEYLDSVLEWFCLDRAEFCDSLVFVNFQYNKNMLPSSDYVFHNAGLQSWIDSGVFE